MNITLPPDQRKWLEAEVAAGHYESLDEALASAVSGLMDLAADDLAWAKPQVDQARASLARGDVLPGGHYLKQLETKIAKLHST